MQNFENFGNVLKIIKNKKKLRSSTFFYSPVHQQIIKKNCKQTNRQIFLLFSLSTLEKFFGGFKKIS